MTALYLLLTHGHHPPNWRFAGSATLGGWENIAYYLRQLNNSGPTFPPHTSSQAGRVPGILHLALRGSERERRDVLLTDAPGEWFEKWAFDGKASAAQGVKWIARQSSAFVLVADCEALSGENRGDVRANLSVLAERLGEEAEQRRVAVVWAKSDIAIRDTIRASLRDDFNRYFANFQEFETRLPEKRVGFESVLKILEWVLAPVAAPQRFQDPRWVADDAFLAFRGE